MAKIEAGKKFYHRSKERIRSLKPTRMWFSESPRWIREDTNGYGRYLHTYVSSVPLEIFDPVDDGRDYDRLMGLLSDRDDDLRGWIEYNMEEYYFPSGAYSEIGTERLSDYDGYREGEDGYYSNYCLFDPTGKLKLEDVFDTESEEGEARLDDMCDSDVPDVVDSFMDWFDQYDSGEDDDE